MTLTEITLKWSNTWKFDYWWRKKYNVPFNSEAHRNMSQIDIRIEYVEHRLAQKFQDDMAKEDRDREHFKKTGNWLRDREDKKADDELFKKIDLSSFA